VSAEPALATSLFADRLAEAVERKRSQLVVGLDPRPDLLPVELVGDPHFDRAGAAEGCARFCRGIVDSVAPHVVAWQSFTTSWPPVMSASDTLWQLAGVAGSTIVPSSERACAK